MNPSPEIAVELRGLVRALDLSADSDGALRITSFTGSDVEQARLNLRAVMREAADLITSQAVEIERLKTALADPNTVHLNMLRGGIAKLTAAQIGHLYRGADAADVVQEVIRQNPDACGEPTEAMVSAGMVAAQLESVDKPFTWSNAVKAAYRAMVAVALNPSLDEPATDSSLQTSGLSHPAVKL